MRDSSAAAHMMFSKNENSILPRNADTGKGSARYRATMSNLSFTKPRHLAIALITTGDDENLTKKIINETCRKAFTPGATVTDGQEVAGLLIGAMNVMMHERSVLAELVDDLLGKGTTDHLLSLLVDDLGNADDYTP